MPKTKPAYSEAFRRDAVELLVTSGRPLKEVADELGVISNTLRAWRNKDGGAGARGAHETGVSSARVPP
jgi:transposase